MLRTFTAVVVTLMSLSASASFYDSNYAPRGFDSINTEALKVCQSLAFDSSKMACLSVIQGKRFANSAVQVCGELSFDSSKTACLQSIAGLYFQRDAVNFCSNEMSFDSSKQTCLTSVANKAYQAEAVQVCEKVSFESSKQACMNSIANKIFDPRLLSFCSNNSFDSQVLACVNQLQFRNAIGGNYSDQNSYNNDQGSIDLSITIDFGSGRVILGGRVSTNDYGTGYNPGGSITIQTGTPHVDTTGTCVVKQTGERVSTEQFYSLVSAKAVRDNKCAIGRLANTAGSGRIYDQNGRRVAPELGGLTYEKVADVKRAAGLRGCSEFTCDRAQN